MSRTLIRFWAYDQCLQNRKIKYTWKDLLKKANEASEEAGYEPIKKTMFYKDIHAMQAPPYRAPIETIKEGRDSYYRYSDPDFSIKNQKLNELEAEELKSALMVLSRFKGMPQFDWVNEIIPKIEQQFGLNNESTSIIGFDENVDLKGMEFFGELFNAILYKKPLIIHYQSFKSTEPKAFEISPFYLKQHNNRWFLFGQVERFPGLTVLSLDRIEAIKETKTAYIQNTSYDFDEYFEDIIGVTKPEGQECEKITLWFSPSQSPYIKTKPLHGTQKQRFNEDGSSEVTIEVISNFELQQLILSYGEHCRVLGPDNLAGIMSSRVKKMMDYI
ncbi:MAG: helix-turn-helix transcriptional regulator [Bacteroidota bacterium]